MPKRAAPPLPLPPRPKRVRPFLGHAVNKAGQIRFLSAKQILAADDKQSGCPRKWANDKVFGKKLARPDYLDEGVSLAEVLEVYHTTGAMVLTPALQRAIKFLPDPRNEAGELDLICEEPLGQIEKALALRDHILARPNAPNLSEALVKLDELAGLTIRGIPFDGAADWVHRRGTYKNKEGVLVREMSGLTVIGNGDFKSTSQINTHITPNSARQGWAQTDAEVVEDPQMVAYAKHRLKMWKDATHVRSEKVYAQKKPYGADIRGGLVSRQQVEDRWGALGDRVVDEMIQVATAQKIEDVRPATGSCDSYNHLIPCGFPGCGIGCFPGKIRSAAGIETVCPFCKGKAKKKKGCGYRGTENCPLSASVKVSLISLSLDTLRAPTGAASMSLFDRIPASSNAPTPPPVAPTPPTPPVDAAAWAAQVAAEEAALEEELAADDEEGSETNIDFPQESLPTPPNLPEKTPSPPAPTPPHVSPDKNPEKQTEIPLASTIGERISVSLCAVGEDYMVDVQDGHSPYRMTLSEVSKGQFRFRGKVGDFATLDVTDHVFRLAPNAAPAPLPPLPEKTSCGAAGCGVGCAPGGVLDPAAEGGIKQCVACWGKGAVSATSMAVKPPDAPKTPWLNQQQPLPDEELAKLKADPNTDPELLKLVIEHKRLWDEEQAKIAAADPATPASRGGNCKGSGVVVTFATQPTVVDGKVVCPVCGAERPIPKDIRKARPMPTEMSFPGHRKPKEDAAKPVVTIATTNVPVPPVAPTPPTVTAAPVVPVPPVPPITPVVPVPPTTPVVIGAILTLEDVTVLSMLFGDRAKSMPRDMFGEKTVKLLQRLRFLD